MIERDDIIPLINEVVKKVAPNSNVILYGSRARGDFKPDSDWDLLVLPNLNTIPFEIETKFMDAFYELELETGQVISPLIYPKKDWEENYSSSPLFENIKKEGIRLS